MSNFYEPTISELKGLKALNHDGISLYFLFIINLKGSHICLYIPKCTAIDGLLFAQLDCL